MLTTCPECELPVSDKAAACPHCGYPLKTISKNPIRKKSRMRLPNGFGQISEIKGRNLRKPFRAMITVGKNSKGRPICKPLKPDAYFETYNEAYAALVEYNKNPYDLAPAMTVKELYEKWTESHFPSLKSESSERTVSSAWAYCSSVYDMRAKDLRARHIKGCMEEGVAIFDGKEHHPTAGIKARIKSMFNLMLDYALEYEIVDKNYARTFYVSADTIKEREDARMPHIAFKDWEIEKLWENINVVPYADIVLIQAYSGLRPGEIGEIKRENVNITDWYFVGGIKTPAGIDRVVPIHPKIRDLVLSKYQGTTDSEYAFICTDTKRYDKKLTYDKYVKRFKRVVERLGLNPEHKAHDPRKHFVTMAKKAGVDEYAIKYIVGHQISDLTERVYTEREITWLKEEIEKIK